MHVDAIIETLRHTAIFGHLNEQHLTELSHRCRVRRYRRGQYLWYQGDPGDYLVVIADGLVKVTASTSRGDEMVLATCGPPDEIGQLALLDQGPRSASAITMEPTTAIVIERTALLELLRHSPETVDALLRSMGGLIRRLTDRAADLAFLDLTGRVAKLLLTYGAQQAAEAPADAGRVRLDMTQTELAQMVGGSRQAVNRVLQDLAGRGHIRFEGRAVIILDRARLARRAES